MGTSRAAEGPLDRDTSWARQPLARVGREILLMGILRPLIWVHNRPKVYGRERLRGLDPPLLFASNHASHLDTPIIMQSLPFRLRCRTGVVAAADYFFKNPFTAAFVSLAFATVPIERNGLSERSVERIERMIAERWNILLFPEGTRSRTGKMGRLKSGTAYMAVQYQVPVVPVYLTGTYQSHPVGSNWPKPHRVTVRFGDPLYPPAGGDHRVLTDKLRDAFASLAAESGRADP